MLRPLPGLPVIRDLIVDMTQFFKQYHSIKPYLINDDAAAGARAPAVARGPRGAERPLRVHPVRLLLDLLPVVLVESGQVRRPGRPAAGLPLHRRHARPGDRASASTIWKTRIGCSAATRIMNCVDVCPKGLNPTRAIGKIKDLHGAGAPYRRCTSAHGPAAARSIEVALPARLAGTGPRARALPGSATAQTLSTRKTTAALERTARPCTDNDLWDLVSGRSDRVDARLARYPGSACSAC